MTMGGMQISGNIRTLVDAHYEETIESVSDMMLKATKRDAPLNHKARYGLNEDARKISSHLRTTDRSSFRHSPGAALV